jgi:hypothetical protein
MGAKTSLLAITDAEIAPLLRTGAGSDPEAAAALVRSVFPGHAVSAADGTSLADAVLPPEGTTYAVALPVGGVLADRSFARDLPSTQPPEIRSAGRRVITHAMHSVVDWFAFSVWEGGDLVRSLSLSPEGIAENIGDPLPFELPYWAGEHTDDPDYPLPFHPLDLGDEACRAFFGFVQEGTVEPDDLDPEQVRMYGFHVTRPRTGLLGRLRRR